MSRLELFCSVDDFWQQVAPSWHQDAAFLRAAPALAPDSAASK
jgi:hypothetical protein